MAGMLTAPAASAVEIVAASSRLRSTPRSGEVADDLIQAKERVPGGSFRAIDAASPVAERVRSRNEFRPAWRSPESAQRGQGDGLERRRTHLAFGGHGYFMVTSTSDRGLRDRGRRSRRASTR